MFIERCVIEWCVWELGDRNQGVWNVGSQSKWKDCGIAIRMGRLRDRNQSVNTAGSQS